MARLSEELAIVSFRTAGDTVATGAATPGAPAVPATAALLGAAATGAAGAGCAEGAHPAITKPTATANATNGIPSGRPMLWSSRRAITRGTRALMLLIPILLVIALLLAFVLAAACFALG